MRIANLGQHALASCAVAAMLVGCGGSPPPIGMPGAMPQSRVTPAGAGRSWMKPGTSNQDLLYVTGYEDEGLVDIYTYPQGEKVGAITGLVAPQGACVDAAGNVFVTDRAPESNSSVIYEYAHGGTTPIATLSDPAFATGCAVDPATGNLAVSGVIGTTHYRGAVAVYANAEGTPSMYYGAKSIVGFLYCVYNNHSDLYVTEYFNDSGEAYAVGRLAHGRSRIDQIMINKPIRGFPELPPSALWDGKRVVISSVRTGPDGKVSLYRLAISGKTARVVGTTVLNHCGRRETVGQAWLFGGMVFSSIFQHYYSHIAWWRYPNGGKPSGISSRVFVSPTQPLGLTLSPAQSSKAARVDPRH